MGFPHNGTRRARIVAALLSGRTLEDVAAEFGIKPNTARGYQTEAKGGDARVYKGKEKRCKCGLLWPCECGNRGMRAEDFMRSGEAEAGTVGIRFC